MSADEISSRITEPHLKSKRAQARLPPHHMFVLGRYQAPDIYLRLRPSSGRRLWLGQYTIVSNPSKAKLLTVEIYFERMHGLIISRCQLHR